MNGLYNKPTPQIMYVYVPHLGGYQLVYGGGFSSTPTPAPRPFQEVAPPPPPPTGTQIEAGEAAKRNDSRPRSPSPRCLPAPRKSFSTTKNVPTRTRCERERHEREFRERQRAHQARRHRSRSRSRSRSQSGSRRGTSSERPQNSPSRRSRSRSRHSPSPRRRRARQATARIDDVRELVRRQEAPVKIGTTSSTVSLPESLPASTMMPPPAARVAREPPPGLKRKDTTDAELKKKDDDVDRAGDTGRKDETKSMSNPVINAPAQSNSTSILPSEKSPLNSPAEPPPPTASTSAASASSNPVASHPLGTLVSAQLRTGKSDAQLRDEVKRLWTPLWNWLKPQIRKAASAATATTPTDQLAAKIWEDAQKDTGAATFILPFLSRGGTQTHPTNANLHVSIRGQIHKFLQAIRNLAAHNESKQQPMDAQHWAAKVQELQRELTKQQVKNTEMNLEIQRLRNSLFSLSPPPHKK